MSDDTLQPTEDKPDNDDTASELSVSQTLEFSSVPPDRRSVSLFSENIFRVDDSTFKSSMPKVSHWSIAWSDLMMTMFILFLSMFVYQAAHKEFLVSDEIEVIGGETTEALDIGQPGQNNFPFVVIDPAKPLMSDGVVKKVESIQLQDIDANTPFFDTDRKGGLDRIKESFKQDQPAPAENPDQIVNFPETQDNYAGITDQALSRGSTESGDDTESTSLEASDVDQVFSLSNEKIAKLGLHDFAEIDLVPDKTMRIVLTGDLLFETGMAELNHKSISSLEKIAEIIKQTEYMINVVGHTDNIPMHSERYPTNWELSVARASTVARFLVEEIGMNPQQFVVSGYSSFRPLRANTNARNRAVNRRVEIIISKRLPSPVSATVENIK